MSGSRRFHGMFLWDMTEVADLGRRDLPGGVNFAFLGVSNWRFARLWEVCFYECFCCCRPCLHYTRRV